MDSCIPGYSWADGDTNNLISIQDILSDNGCHTTFINTELDNYQFLRYLESFEFDDLSSEEIYGDGSELVLNKFHNMNYQFGQFMEKLEASDFNSIFAILNS